MPLFEVSESGLRPQSVATFKELGMYERVDLQPLLRDGRATSTSRPAAAMQRPLRS